MICTADRRAVDRSLHRRARAAGHGARRENAPIATCRGLRVVEGSTGRADRVSGKTNRRSAATSQTVFASWATGKDLRHAPRRLRMLEMEINRASYDVMRKPPQNNAGGTRTENRFTTSVDGDWEEQNNLTYRSNCPPCCRFGLLKPRPRRADGHRKAPATIRQGSALVLFWSESESRKVKGFAPVARHPAQIGDHQWG
jgi:hypothetical protein